MLLTKKLYPEIQIIKTGSYVSEVVRNLSLGIIIYRNKSHNDNKCQYGW